MFGAVYSYMHQIKIERIYQHSYSEDATEGVFIKKERTMYN